MDKKDRKEEEKREKKEQKEREKREKEREKERKSNRSPRPAPVISGPILPPSMMSPLPLSRSASTRGSPPSDPAPVVVGSHSKLQQLLGAEVPVPNGTTAGSVSKVQHLLGEIPPGATAPARPIPPALGSSIPKPLDPGGSRREVNKETVLPPPPLLKCVTFDQVMHYLGHRFVLIFFLFRPLVKPKAALTTGGFAADLPPPPAVPPPHRPGSMPGEYIPSPTESPTGSSFPTFSIDDLLDANIKSMGGEDEPAKPVTPVPQKEDMESDDSSETDSEEVDTINSAVMSTEAPNRESIDSPVRDLYRDPADAAQDWCESPAQEEVIDVAMDPIVRSRELSATDLLPPPDSRAIEAASLWSDDPPASASTPPVALSPVPVVAKPKATKHSSPFRLMLAQAVRRSPAHAFFIFLSMGTHDSSRCATGRRCAAEGGHRYGDAQRQDSSCVSTQTRRVDARAGSVVALRCAQRLHGSCSTGADDQAGGGPDQLAARGGGRGALGCRRERRTAASAR